jgi:FkbM family methyltransferase
LDVGANMGQTIENLLESLKDPYVYSFEPSKNIFDMLRHRDYGNKVFLFNYALGSKNQEREFINYQNPFNSIKSLHRTAIPLLSIAADELDHQLSLKTISI